jgi:ubiquitin-like protein Pup
MTQQDQKRSKKQHTEDNEEIETEAKDLQNPELDEDVDDLLDEIDDVLEENAQGFVDSFVQQGGE